MDLSESLRPNFPDLDGHEISEILLVVLEKPAESLDEGAALRRGDRIVTNGGLVGLVTSVKPEEREIQVEIADGVRVKVMRDMIASVLTKTEPVAAKSAEDAKA